MRIFVVLYIKYNKDVVPVMPAAVRKDGDTMPKSLPLQQLDDAVASVTSHIHDYTKSEKDFTRKRKLDADTLIKTTLNMQGNSLNAELYDAFPDIDERMTASAYEQAKGKLSYKAFEDVFQEYNKSMSIKTMDRVIPYRVYAIDGSSFSVPYDKGSEFAIDKSGWKNVIKQKANGTEPKNLAMMHGNFLFDLCNRAYQDCIVQTMDLANERDAAIDMVKRLNNSSPFIVIMDRGYSGFNMFETMNCIPNCYYAIRVKTSDIKEIRELPDEECDREITFRITTSNHFYTQNHKADPYLHLVNTKGKSHTEHYSKNTVYHRWDFGQFCEVKCRVVKFRINDEESGKEQWEVLVTNLNRFEFPIERMKELYHMRWDIETSFRELKYSLGAISFHSKKPDFIRMELFAHLTMFNAVSRHIVALSVPQTGHKHKYAIDFKMACKAVRRYYRLYVADGDIWADILSYINPVRPGRQDKRRMRYKPAVWFLYRVA